ncbi:hypothetical protein ACFC1B_29970 [Streptomyces xiamenensis]|uniref:hypothetical protein n=1 Tax=Streptomyces xiamenensis TaxID=408015 RepID=UPI0035DFC07F
MTQSQPKIKATPAVTYVPGDFVLARNPEKFWLGRTGHTYVARVERSYDALGKTLYDLTELSSGHLRKGIDPDYMRLLPAADAMRDIDTAPLVGADAGAMSPAAVAWLRQQLQPSSAPLPRQS